MKGEKYGWLLRYCVYLLLGCCSCSAFGDSVDLYKASVAAATTGVALDVASSWGHYEAQPLYRSSNGRFQTKGAILRIGMFAGALIAQKIARKKAPKNKKLRRALTAINFAVCGSSTGAAIHNWRQ